MSILGLRRGGAGVSPPISFSLGVSFWVWRRESLVAVGRRVILSNRGGGGIGGI